MNANSNPVRKSIILLFVFFIAFAAMVTMACDEGPCKGLTDTTCAQQTGKQAVDTVLFQTTELEGQIQKGFCQKGNISNPDCK